MDKLESATLVSHLTLGEILRRMLGKQLQVRENSICDEFSESRTEAVRS